MSTAPVKDKVDPQVMRVAMILIVGALAVVFDTTIVSVALRTLAVQLHTSIATIQWVSTGYLLALGVTIPLVGWAQNRFGGKRVWMFALVVFLAGSIGSSLAWSAGSLIGFRVLQGVGGGLMLPLLPTLVMQAAAGKSLGRTMSVVSLPAVLGPILGPVIGGIILNWLDWRWLFYVNIPFCVVGFLLAWKMLPTDPKTPRKPLDLLGFVLLSPGIVGILYGLSNASKTNGFARGDVYAPMLVGIALLFTFVFYALRRGSGPWWTFGSSLIVLSLQRQHCSSFPAQRSTGRCCSCRCTSRTSAVSTRSAPAFFSSLRGSARSSAARSPGN